MINSVSEIYLIRGYYLSKFSGKCDVYDTLISIHQYTNEELKNNVKIYVGGGKEPLQINSEKDLIPYYPYIVASASFNNPERKSIIQLSKESWVDTEERDSLQFKLSQVLKVYNRYQRKKEFFDKDVALDIICHTGFNRDICEEIVERVAKYGKKANIDGLHLMVHEIYRRELVEVMLNNGLNPADYGYERFCEL